MGGVHRGVHQNVDYNFFTLSVYINNQFSKENQHQQRIMKINNQQLRMPEIYNFRKHKLNQHLCSSFETENTK